MSIKQLIVLSIILPVLLSSCAKRLAVDYAEVEKTNSVDIRLISGKKISGSVEKVEPHQLTLLERNRTVRVISKPTISTIRRKPPVYDDFGNGISEVEITQVKKNTNAVVYGIGGGLLSIGGSFFLGSIIGKNSTPLWAATTGTGGILGTVLFTSAGKARDRKIAIEEIREKRRRAQIKIDHQKKAKDDDQIEKLLEEEKQKQKALRKEREKLLKELEKKKK
jgi:hypothetical protein